MIIDVSTADVVSVYQALVGVVDAPADRLGDDVDGEGRVNLAPFSFFNAFGANPPVVVFSPDSTAATARRRTRCSTWRRCPSSS